MTILDLLNGIPKVVGRRIGFKIKYTQIQGNEQIIISEYLDYRITLGREPSPEELERFREMVGNPKNLDSYIGRVNRTLKHYEELKAKQQSGPGLSAKEKSMIQGMDLVYSHHNLRHG